MKTWKETVFETLNLIEKHHYDSNIFKHKPWIIFGDFNEILDVEEHSGFEYSPNITSGMRDFQDVVRYCSLTDLASQGPLYTWCNKREEGLISKKLDRVLVNENCPLTFPHSYNVFETGGCSDHLRCRIHLTEEEIFRRKPFKFVNVVADLQGFLPLMEKYWEDTEPLYLSTSSMFRFSKKLKHLKPKIRELAKEKLGNLTKKAKEAYDDLCVKQERNLKTPTTQNMIEENIASKRWENVATIEEKYLKQKSKLHWLKVGDRNNKYFHKGVAQRVAQNTIREIQRGDGTIVHTSGDIKEEAEVFFKKFLQHKPHDYAGISVASLHELVPHCREEDHERLIREVKDEEIKDVLFSMPNDKSPDPDGYTSEFFKKAWQVIGKEFTIAVKSFFVKGFLPKGVNTTILALIPKKLGANEMKDYSPISCCNVIYKVVSKIIANRLKEVLPDLISLNQSAFIKDRLLIENLLLATELVKDYHKDSISSRCAIKIDISKAFDSVQWEFLLNTLTAMNFPAKLIQWIRLCVTTASFSVQVNGELAGFFKSERGLRQGCSLSPYLFVICINVLSQMLDMAAAARQIGYHPKCQNI